MATNERPTNGAINEDLVDRVVQEVRKQIGGLVPDSVLREQTREALADLQGAKVPTFVPLLVAQAVLRRFRESNRAWSARKVAAGTATIVVLFVCVHNSGRSVMAETFVNQLAAARGLRVHAQSAGTHPGAGGVAGPYLNGMAARCWGCQGDADAAHRQRRGLGDLRPDPVLVPRRGPACRLGRGAACRCVGVGGCAVASEGAGFRGPCRVGSAGRGRRGRVATRRLEREAGRA